MLISHELYAIHSTDEYIAYIKANTSDNQSLMDLTRYFDKWHLKNRRQLHSLYEEAADKEKHTTFIAWAREHFYLWAFNQERKKIDSEIEEMTNDQKSPGGL